MLLYHGTGETAAREAMQAGLLPRRLTKKSNWKHTVPSNPGAVYLTDAYPGYFAANAASRKERMAIIEVDSARLDPWRLGADEDVLEQALRRQDDLPQEWTMRQRTLYYRKRQFDYSWE